MLKFNNDNIITGYIKQLLAEFNLPKYRVYPAKQFNQETLERINFLREHTRIIPNVKVTGTISANPDSEKQEYLSFLLERIELGDPDVNILPSIHRTDLPKYSHGDCQEKYPENIFYAPYIKDGLIQEFVNGEWKNCRTKGIIEANSAKPHHGQQMLPKYYTYNTPELNYTKNLNIKNSIYDSYTHEYLGDYLRFQRDYNHINLMPLYNCFSNRDCEHLDLSVEIIPGISGYTAEFKTSEDYKIYMIPVKLFQNYTIAIDCEGAVEMCCGFYDKYQHKDTADSVLTASIAHLAQQTYTCYNSLQFATPVLFDKLFKIKALLIAKLGEDAEKYLRKIASLEDSLKLFIKIPRATKSSITVLEGNYINFNNRAPISLKLKPIEEGGPDSLPMEVKNKKLQDFFTKNPQTWRAITTLFNYLIKPFAQLIEEEKYNPSITRTAVERAKEIIDGFPQEGINFYKGNEILPTINKFGINISELENLAYIIYSDEDRISENTALREITNATVSKPLRYIAKNNVVINFEAGTTEQLDLTNKLISPLQLLRTNTGISYPFADRLIEYLVGNTITPIDDITDNISRAKSVAKANVNFSNIDLTTPGLWTSALQLIFYNYMVEHYNSHDVMHDILGYVDKEVESLYQAETSKTYDINGNEIKEGTTISQINIYSEWED